jgi:uncharacterized membrane protein YcaP (DUF421 family)
MTQFWRIFMTIHIPWLFSSISTLVTFAFLLVLVRWIGSTQLTQLTFFNWVAGASMGNIAANMISATSVSTWLMNGYTLLLFTIVSIMAAYIAVKNRSFRLAANGQPIVLIHKGNILRRNTRAAKLNIDVLLMMLREKGYFEYSMIEYAILEPTGNLSILPAQATQTVTKEDLVKGPDLSNEGQGPYTPIVIDGVVDKKRLAYRGLSMDWVNQKVKEFGAKSVKDIVLLGVSKDGEIISDVHKEGSQSEIKDLEL